MNTRDPEFEAAKSACETAVDRLVEDHGAPIIPVLLGAIVVWAMDNGASDLLLGTVRRIEPTIAEATMRYKAMMH